MQTSVSDLQGPRVGGDSNKLAGRSPAPPALGFLLADASLRPLFANREAVTILTYPGPPQSLAATFDKQVRRFFVRDQGSPSNGNEAPLVIHLKSGRRSYFCRAFLLNEGPACKDATALIVFERAMPASLALSQVYQQFRLTQREQETVTLLLQGLGNKEMADRMRVSPNTVKAFLRLVMIKMGVPSRCAIAAKVLDRVFSPQLGAGLVHRDSSAATMGQPPNGAATRLLHRSNRKLPGLCFDAQL